jgi:hypothetical protein
MLEGCQFFETSVSDVPERQQCLHEALVAKKVRAVRLQK